MSSVATGIRGPCRGVVSLATNRRALDSPPRTKSRVGVRTRWNGGSGVQRRDPPPQVVEGDAVIERGRLDNEFVSERQEPNVGILVRYPVPRYATGISEDDDGVAIFINAADRDGTEPFTVRPHRIAQVRHRLFI